MSYYVSSETLNFYHTSLCGWVLTKNLLHLGVTLMPSSHHWHGEDCLVLSCWCRRSELNWKEVKTVGDRKFQNLTCLLFCSFVLSQNVGLDKTVQSQIYSVLLKSVVTCLQFSSHRRHWQDKTISLVLSV